MSCRSSGHGIFAQLSPDIHTRSVAGQRVVRQIALCKHATELPQSSVVRFLDLDVSVPQEWSRLEHRCLAADQKEAQIRRELSPRIYRVPHTVSAAACRCSLTGTTTARRFQNKALNRFLAALFSRIPQGIIAAGLPEIQLSRFDLHHAHLFACEYGLGLLFHSQEYIGPGDIDVGNLGNCQIGTPLKFSNEAMAWRNIVWIGNNIASLNVGPDSALHAELLMDGLHEVCTVLEHDLGEPLADIYYIEELGGHGRAPGYRIFVV